MALGTSMMVVSPLLLYMKLLIRWVVSPHHWDQYAGEEGPLPSKLLHLCRGHCKWMGRQALPRPEPFADIYQPLTDLGSVKVFPPDEMEEVSDKEDTGTSLKRAEKETS